MPEAKEAKKMDESHQMSTDGPRAVRRDIETSNKRLAEHLQHPEEKITKLRMKTDIPALEDDPAEEKISNPQDRSSHRKSSPSLKNPRRGIRTKEGEY